MKKLLPIITLIVTRVSLSAGPQRFDDRWERAYQTWDNGDYITAVREFDALLRGSDADRIHSTTHDRENAESENHGSEGRRIDAGGSESRQQPGSVQVGLGAHDDQARGAA